MSIFQPTAFYFGQPIAASAVFIVRPDTYSSSVTIAIPGTQFGSTFGQTDFRSDISGYINGGSSLNPASPALSGSGQTTNAATNFSAVPYGTSMARTLGNLGAIPGNSTQVAFGTGSFTIECWMYMPTNVSGDNVWFFNYSGGSGFAQYNGGPRFTYEAGGSELGFYPGKPTLSANTWYHFAMSRTGSRFYAAVNGTIIGSSSLAGTSGTTPGFGLMGWNGNGSQRTDYFQDFRVTKGVARYTQQSGSAYTVPGSIVMAG